MCFTINRSGPTHSFFRTILELGPKTFLFCRPIAPLSLFSAIFSSEERTQKVPKYYCQVIWMKKRFNFPVRFRYIHHNSPKQWNLRTTVKKYFTKYSLMPAVPINVVISALGSESWRLRVSMLSPPQLILRDHCR